jgi:hypothetical protein
MTQFTILVEDTDIEVVHPDEVRYRIVQEGVVARSGKAAVDYVVNTLEDPPAYARYIAVPTRHWHELSVRTSVQTRIEIA